MTVPNPWMIDRSGLYRHPNDEGHAAWLMVEDGARPVDESLFPWERVLGLAGPRGIDPVVYFPGSEL